MAKKKEKAPDEGSPAWMSTFSDLMNLLLCFFVLLFASSTMDQGKIEQIAASFQNITFSIFTQTSSTIMDGAMVSGGVTQLEGVQSLMTQVGKAVDNTDGQDSHAEEDKEVDPESNDGGGSGGNTATEEKDKDQQVSDDDNTSAAKASEASTEISSEEKMEELQEAMEEAGLEQSQEMYEEIMAQLESYTIDDKVQIDYNYEFVELDMNGALLFDSGKAELKPEALAFMGKIASILNTYQTSVIEIQGHTDNVPIHSLQYPSNRYLSTARANSVYEYLMDNSNLLDSNLKIAGYGESRPVATNDTPEGRAKNRRVVIKIYNQLSSSQE